MNFKRMLKVVFLFLLALFCKMIFFANISMAGSNNLILTEIMFNPAGIDNTDEFIEMYNNNDEAINLKRWQIGDEKSLDFISDAGMGLILKPHEYCIIADRDGINPMSSYLLEIPDSALIVTIAGNTFGSRGLSNSKPELVRLISPDGTIASSSFYNTDVSEGFSWEKIDILKDNSSDNWSSSKVYGGTPGAPNSVSVKVEHKSQISIYPNPFSPDNDGFEDFTLINYKLPLNRPVVTIRIFDLAGNCVKTLLNCFYSPPSYNVRWDGTDMHSEQLLRGIYIVHLEAIDPTNGKKTTMQKCVVIA